MSAGTRVVCFERGWSRTILGETRVVFRDVAFGSAACLWSRCRSGGDREPDLISLCGRSRGGSICTEYFVDRSTGVVCEEGEAALRQRYGRRRSDSANLRFDRFVVEPSLDRNFSLASNCTRFVSCRSDLQFLNCRIQNEFDEAIHVHGPKASCGGRSGRGRSESARCDGRNEAVSFSDPVMRCAALGQAWWHRITRSSWGIVFGDQF